MIRLLFIGDIVGKPGKQMVLRTLPLIREQEQIDFVIANAENCEDQKLAPCSPLVGIVQPVAYTAINWNHGTV